MADYEETGSQRPQVFLNYRGAELRQSFIAHLEKALKRSGVNVYVDCVELKEFLFKGIEESSIALVILTRRYTESRLCLDELVKIKERVEEGELMAIPIFYELNPSIVQGLDGDFGYNLWNHVKRTSEFDKLKQWKEALDFFSQKLGLVFHDKSSEPAFINDIIFHVHEELRRDGGVNFRKNDADGDDDDLLGEENSDDSAEDNRVASVNEEKKQENVSETSPVVTLDKPLAEHQVFISFRGAEVRHGFVSHLVEALERNGVNVYVYSVELKARNIDVLNKRIKESSIALVIFSKRYTESRWCLDELVEIKKLMDEGKLVAIPIFYMVEPRKAKKLDGEFGDNFRDLCKTHRDWPITKWKEALKSIASREGIYLKEQSSESEIINLTVKKLLENISQREGEMHETSLHKCPLFLTTLAMMLYEKWKHRFIRRVLLQDIRGNSEKYVSVRLRETLWERLLKRKFPVIGDETTYESTKGELLKTKIFVVLDDVSDKQQLEFLLGDRDWIKKGSMIVITTSDKSLLEGFVDDTYVVPKLNDSEAFQLFSYHAFRDHIHSRDSTFLKLSRMFVDYAEGHPLALKILGSELCGRDEAYWESKLEKSEDEYFVRSLLDSGDPDSTDAVSEVKDLVNKFLITIVDGRVEMNVPLCTFSKDLASPQCLRLWNYKDIISELKQKSDANNVRGIFLDMSKLTTSVWLEPLTFINMRNLRYMKIYDSCCPRQCEAECKFNFSEGFNFPLEEVRYFHWLKFPLAELPPDFRPENLVDLRLPYSNITHVWEGEKDIPRLKFVDLSYSSELLDLSALSKAENLQRLNLEGCTSLYKLPVGIKNMKSLVCLNLRGCIGLCFLPKMNLISLKTLILSDCSNLYEFQLVSKSLETLHLDGTAIKGLPRAMRKLQRLVVLNLKNCKMLKCLPNCLGNLKALEKLILSGCSRLDDLPDVRNSLKHLQVLLFDGTGAKEMPSTSCFTGSKGTASADMFLQPQGTRFSVREWPCGVDRISSLRRLCLSRSNFVSLQPDIWKLYNLKWLDVKHCTSLISVPMLPPRLQYFDAHGCVSLERVANPIAFSMLSDQSHATFNFSNCNNLDQDAKGNIIAYTRWRSQLVLDELTQYNVGLLSDVSIGTCFPGWEVPTWFSHRAIGSVLKPKLHVHWSDNKFTGIGLCAVIVFDGYHNQRNRVVVKCNCEFKNGDGSIIRFSCAVGGWSEPSNTPRKIESSHVFIGFASRMSINKIVEEKCVCTEASIEFEVTDGMEEIKGCEVVKCGFTLCKPKRYELGEIVMRSRIRS
ncbi:unnamed protein product [Microthlaspi erraticum]|uniref:TIR domain-containing protein n=1 Tax=Microthlaspi erraticum TaxID=1685480 RepID=A0A6D2L4M0_9BRAS|nr:unnamed protein product [Microthlaspi erraticum]